MMKGTSPELDNGYYGAGEQQWFGYDWQGKDLLRSKRYRPRYRPAGSGVQLRRAGTAHRKHHHHSWFRGRWDRAPSVLPLRQQTSYADAGGTAILDN